MKFPNWLKIIWWIILIIGLSFFVSIRYYALIDYGAQAIDIIALSLLTVLILVPLFSEIEYLGLKVKRDLEEFKKEVGDKFLIINSIQNLRQEQNVFLGSDKPSDGELKKQSEQFEKVKTKEKINDKESITEPIDYDIFNSLLELVKKRIILENELRRIWKNKVNFIQPTPVKNKTGVVALSIDLYLQNVIDKETLEIIQSLGFILNDAAHGVQPNSTQESFVENNFNSVISILRSK